MSSDTDGFFGFVVGLYAATVAAPAVAIGIAVTWSNSPDVLFFALLGSVVLVAGVVGWLARRETLAVRLGATRWVWGAMALPFVDLVGLFAAEVAGVGTLTEPAAAIALVGALVGLLAGVGLVAASHNRHAKALLADAPPEAEFSARAPARDRTLVNRAAGGLFVLSVVGFVAGILVDFDPLRWVSQILFPAAAGLAGNAGEREVRISAAGLVTGSPAHKRLRPWSAFESYDVTGEAVVVRREGWSPWGLRDVRRDATEVEDPEAVADALGEFLPRRKLQ